MKKLSFLMSALLIISLGLGLAIHKVANAAVPGVNSLVSVNNTGNGQGGNSNSPHNVNGLNQVISANGRYVVFTSSASNLVSGDTNGLPDVFLRDLLNNTTTRIDVSTSGVEANGNISDSTGDKVAISSTGRYVAFTSTATNLIDGQTILSPQVYMRDTMTNTTSVVTQNNDGILASRTPQNVNSISSDGRFVVWSGNLDTNFTSTETNIFSYYVYLTDLSTKKTATLNHTPSTGQYFVNGISSSCDGSLIAFSTKLALSSSDTDSSEDIYLADIRNGVTITGISTASSSTGVAILPSVSCNGDYVAFNSNNPNIVTVGPVASGTNSHEYLYDRVNGSISLVDTSTSGVISNTGASTYYAGVDNQGDVFFSSSATNLIDSHTITPNEIYLKHRDTGETEIVTKTPGGSIASGANNTGGNVSVSANGKTVVYRVTASTTLLSSDTNGYYDVIASSTGI